MVLPIICNSRETGQLNDNFEKHKNFDFNKQMQNLNAFN